MKCILLLTVFLVGIEYTISFRYKRISNSCSALYGKRLEIIVPDSQLKERIDVYLSGSFKEYSRSFISNLCDENSILVNGKPQSKNYKVRKGDSISFTVEEREVSSVAPEKIPIDILYEDDNIIAVNKAVGMVVHPAVGSPNGTFVNALLYHLGEGLATKLIAESEVYSKTKLSQKFEKDNSIEGLEIALDSENEYAFAEDGYEEDEEDEDEDGENYYLDVSSFPDDFDDLEEEEGEISVNSEFNKVSLSVGNNTNVVTPDLPETPEAAVASHVSLRPGIVHRLDKGTSGVLMAGKSADAVGKLSSVFALRKVRKVYVAVCVGHPGEATIVNSIGRSKKNRQLMEIYDGPPGKTAISHVKTLAFDGKLSVCLVRIETGRTHQIRVHLKERKTPIIGDAAYGIRDWNQKLSKSDSIDRPLLHAYEVQFSHPYTKQLMKICAPLPPDMANLVKKITSFSTELLDENNLLTCSTEVSGSFSSNIRGFVPSDRLVLEEEDWTAMELPEEQPF